MRQPVAIFNIFMLNRVATAMTDMKTLLHQQIDRLDDPHDIQDLLLTVSAFVGQRTNMFAETPALLNQLEEALVAAKTAHLTPHDTVANESKQWITR
ncbi:hypothetical protein [Fibrella aestuarina]|uniref:hypothetical protein n=1 Tax=Fibrella aestuarina TaxID=651143 RepID=UPI001E43C2A9|nr:hypothetical protein [Fibrella aestuarina]